MMETIYKLAMKEELGSSLKIKGFGTNDKYIFKGSDTNGHVTPDEVLDVINDFRKKGKTGEVPISEEDMILYNKDYSPKDEIVYNYIVIEEWGTQILLLECIKLLNR
ncbi:hypothetical protein RhiirA1_402054 [Rhizophagus irregularis]|uniref:Uncharacterized protein n=1 Tax=Rhizophagus irregularis TaxID=588596 RepID=A0A2N0QZV0_9GLOM|nr:hypothetical protein RhiirA1_402054 [Rhizophagus irregularis]